MNKTNDEFVELRVCVELDADILIRLRMLHCMAVTNVIKGHINLKFTKEFKFWGRFIH